ncbi:DUF4468 domain-containing protein [Dysgonomonas sp. 25]|uniref:DUF4468 domain-containing protein n=1 Tax=Dysgonomonas sp. 25 TaxID=2302933 RepID=UPI001C885826|nr:DUF4468 domain-containing protein [Dysgonomonas sp. 25]
MRRLIIISSFLFLAANLPAQIVRLHEDAMSVPVVDSKVVFIKEIPTPKGNSRDDNFTMLKNWAVKNYGKDPFISSVRVDTRAREIIARSRIELLLPADSDGVREQFVMRYRVNGYVYESRCVLEITDISFLYQGTKESNSRSLPKVIRAETFITDDAVNKGGNLKEVRTNARKSTLYFINELFKEYEAAHGY